MGNQAPTIHRQALVAVAWATMLALASCGGTGTTQTAGGDDTTGDESAGDSTAASDETAAGDETGGSEASPWLTRLHEEGMLTYRVEAADTEGPIEVRMLVQQRVMQAGNVAVRLVPIGTPLGETPVYPQWLIGTSEGMGALDESASFTTPGFVPIDERGRLRTEASSNMLWRVETRWLRAGDTASGTEVSVGWTLSERVGAIEEPITASDCVRLERADDSRTSTILVCAGIGVVERVESMGDEVRSRWQLITIGEHPTELQ